MMLILLVVLLFFQAAGYPSQAQSLCEQCVKASQDELKRCLGNAISQKDKISCADKQDSQAKICENSECKAERAQRGAQGEVPMDKTQRPDR